MKKIVFVLLCAFLLATLISCATLLGNDYVIPSNSDFSADSNIWELKAYVDDFRLPTDKKYVTSMALSGLFSNSATTGSSCSAKILVNYRGEVEVVVYEYDKYRVDSYSSEKYTYTLKGIDDGVVVSKGYTWLSDRFVINGDSAIEVIDALCKGGTYILTMAGGKYTTSIYVLTIKGTGCAAVLSEIFPVEQPESTTTK